MALHRSIDIVATEDPTLAPIPISIPVRVYGPDGTAGPADVAHFTALPEAPAGAMDLLTMALTVTKGGEVMGNKMSLCDFISAVLIPNDEDRFVALLRSKTRFINADDVLKLAKQLSEHYGSDRPS